MTTAPEHDSVPQVNEVVRDRMAATLEYVFDQVGRSSLAGLDPLFLAPALAQTTLALFDSPGRVLEAVSRYYTDVAQAQVVAGARAMGHDLPGPVVPGPDRRFADPAWSDNPAFWLLRQQYEIFSRTVSALTQGADVPAAVARKTAFATGTVLDAIAPTNFLATNPAALKKAVETGGQSLARGMKTFLDDLADNNGQPRQIQPDAHKAGRDMALTPGKVVFRNDLMELIQYQPSTATVHEIPLLFSPPWINKYYVLDLAPGRSLVEWAVSKGHTVFLISYRNPDETMRTVTMDDYLLSGPLTAMDVIRDITGSPSVNLLGLCLGGTLTTALLAYLDATGAGDRVNSATFLNTLIDFSEPGMLGVFTDERLIAKLEVSMQETGFLPADSMRGTFDLLRGNDLIWSYAVNNWLLGEEPPAFDLLSWNADATRMPADMHSFYLRSCYLENQLATGTMELAGQELKVPAIKQDLYFLAAEQDHIAPWRSSYAGALLPTGKVRFVLSNSGHIAGIVNPPNPKSTHRVLENEPLPAEPDQWLAKATRHAGTWWEDWAGWIGDHAGAMRKPPTSGNRKHQALADAPGTYVFGA